MIAENNKRGKVYLVGAGPGDHRLLTCRGLELAQEADVILYDRLVNPSLIALLATDIKKIYVGKAPGNHSYSQEEISQLLIKEANKEQVVVRLKGGDPFVFGRGGEEALALEEAGINFEIVPGISSVIAAAAYAGIPVTHRQLSSSFHVYTGHQPARLDFEVLAKLKGTLVFVMGLRNLEQIATSLINNGNSSERSVAVVRYGTTSDQELLTGTLADIANKVEESSIKSPALIIIGEVVELQSKLNWFNKGPLAGKRIMLTRPYKQQSKMGKEIENLGGEVFYYPTIDIKGPLLNEKIKKTVATIADYDWIVFTSVNGVRCFFEILRNYEKDIRELKGTKFAVIGSVTAETLKEKGIYPEFTPSSYTTEVMLAEFLPKIGEKKNILLARADIANEELPLKLREAEHQVNDLSVYETIIPEVDSKKLLLHLQERDLDLITFTSSSTAKNLKEIMGDNFTKIKNLPVACIGPITAKTARNLGFNVEIVADEYTTKGLVEAIIENES